MEKVKRTNNRIILLDVLRGVLLILVMLDHFLYDALYMYKNEFTTQSGVNLVSFCRTYYDSLYLKIVHPVGLCMFFLISGIVNSFSRNKLKRAIKLLIFTVGLFVVTFVFSLITGQKCTIVNGIIFVFTVSSFLEIILEKLKVNNFLLLFLGMAFAVVGELFSFKILVCNIDWLSPLIYCNSGHNTSADYFPILPYVGFFLLGILIAKIFYKEKKPYIKLNKGLKIALSPFSYIGRTSIWWYFGSQIVFIAFFELVVYLGVL